LLEERLWSFKAVLWLTKGRYFSCMCSLCSAAYYVVCHQISRPMAETLSTSCRYANHYSSCDYDAYTQGAGYALGLCLPAKRGLVPLLPYTAVHRDFSVVVAT
jgi:hypothetical protein